MLLNQCIAFVLMYLVVGLIIAACDFEYAQIRMTLCSKRLQYLETRLSTFYRASVRSVSDPEPTEIAQIFALLPKTRQEIVRLQTKLASERCIVRNILHTMWTWPLPLAKETSKLFVHRILRMHTHSPSHMKGGRMH